MPLLPAAVTTGGTPPISIIGRSESTDSLPSDRSEHGWSTGSLSTGAAAAPGWQASGWCATDRAGGSPASVSPSSTSPPTPPQKKSVPPSPLSRDCRNAPSSASSPDMNPHLSPMPAYKTIEEVVTKRQIVCDNCERCVHMPPVPVVQPPTLALWAHGHAHAMQAMQRKPGGHEDWRVLLGRVPMERELCTTRPPPVVSFRPRPHASDDRAGAVTFDDDRRHACSRAAQEGRCSRARSDYSSTSTRFPVPSVGCARRIQNLFFSQIFSAVDGPLADSSVPPLPF